MRTVVTGSGAVLPVLGLGTWEMGRRRTARAAEIAALQLGFDLGLRLVDTAEMYAEGGAEEVVGLALRGRRDEVFVVSKVLPSNASRTGTLHAAERSLRRLGTDRIDLYLLHWPGDHPFVETLEAFLLLQRDGKIRHFGVSNFDLPELEAARALPGGAAIAADQVYYNLARRGIERRLLPWCREQGVAVMAYTPLEQGRLRRSTKLRALARRLGATPAQVALAFTMRGPGMVSIPKAADPEHVRENAAAADLVLQPEDLAELERLFPAPDRDVPLETL